MKRISCCFNCENRKVGCHATCEEYIKESKQREREKAERFAGSKAFNDIESCEVQRSYRAWKYTRKK